MGLSQGFALGLRRSDVTELSLLDQFAEGLGRFLDWNFGVHSSALEQVQLLSSPEVFVDVVDAASQAFLAANSLSRSPEEAEGYNLRRIRARAFQANAPLDGQEGLIRAFGILLVECSE